MIRPRAHKRNVLWYCVACKKSVRRSHLVRVTVNFFYSDHVVSGVKHICDLAREVNTVGVVVRTSVMPNIRTQHEKNNSNLKPPEVQVFITKYEVKGTPRFGGGDGDDFPGA